MTSTRLTACFSSFINPKNILRTVVYDLMVNSERREVKVSHFISRPNTARDNSTHISDKHTFLLKPTSNTEGFWFSAADWYRCMSCREWVRIHIDWVMNAYLETPPRTRQHCGPSFIKSQIARLRLQIFPLWMALHSYVYSCVLLCVINGRLFGWLIFISKPRFLQHWWSGRWIWYAMQVHGLRFRLYLYLSANEEDSGWEILGRQ